MISALPLAFLALVTTTPTESLERAVTSVVGGLHLDNVDGFELGLDLALAVDMSRTEDGEALRPIVHGLARARLERLGAAALIDVSNGRDAPSEARRAGAEWLLIIVGDRTRKGQLRLFATLRVIDRGLWTPIPADDTTAIYAIAEETITLSTTSAPPPPPPPLNVASTTPVLASPAIAMAKLPGKIVSLGACRLTETETDALIVLSDESVSVYSYDRSLKRLATMPLNELPRAEVVVRDAIGAIVCGERERTFAFGHSSLAEGYIVEVTSRARGRFALTRRGQLRGIPLVAIGADDWLLGHADAGTNRFAANVTGSRSAGAISIMPSYAIARSGSVWFAVDADYQLRAGGKNLASNTVVGRAGSALATWTEHDLLFHTSPESDATKDVISMYSTEYRPSSVSLERPAQALAVGRFRTSTVGIVAASYRPDRRDTELFLIRVDGVEANP